MQNKFPTIKDRILYLAEIKGFGKKNFCEKIGMSYGSFTGQAKNTPLNSNAIANILCIVPDVNLHWLLTGIGDAVIVEQELDSSSIRGENTAKTKFHKRSFHGTTPEKNIPPPRWRGIS